MPLLNEIVSYTSVERDKNPISVSKVFRSRIEELTEARKNDSDFRMIQDYASNNVLRIALESYYPLCNREKSAICSMAMNSIARDLHLYIAREV